VRARFEEAIAAFREAFSPTDHSVGLVLKINNYDEEEGDRLRSLTRGYENIHFVHDTLNRYEVDSLLACCDSFVSLHRSEGFGLAIAEVAH
jgi:glycosyltransferase involved in cell wall biosynthesis